MPYRILSFSEKLVNKLNVQNPYFRRLSKLLSGSLLDKNERLLNYFRWTANETITGLFSERFKTRIHQNRTENTSKKARELPQQKPGPGVWSCC